MSRRKQGKDLERCRVQHSLVTSSIQRMKDLIEEKGNLLSHTELECRLEIIENYFHDLISHQIFNTLVHNENSLTVIEKFNHLLSCLSGPALRVVKAFDVTEENYEKALIYQEHIQELFQLQKHYVLQHYVL